MDSITRSSAIGRLTGTLSWIIAGILYFCFDYAMPEEVTKELSDQIYKTITGLLAIWGMLGPVVSKFRQRQRNKEVEERDEMIKRVARI